MFTAIPQGTVLLTGPFGASKRPLTAWASMLCAAGRSKQLTRRKLLCATTPLREKSSMPLTVVSAFVEELSPMPGIPRACLRGFAAVIDIWALSRKWIWERRFAQNWPRKAQSTPSRGEARTGRPRFIRACRSQYLLPNTRNARPVCGGVRHCTSSSSI